MAHPLPGCAAPQQTALPRHPARAPAPSEWSNRRRVKSTVSSDTYDPLRTAAERIGGQIAAAMNCQQPGEMIAFHKP